MEIAIIGMATKAPRFDGEFKFSNKIIEKALPLRNTLHLHNMEWRLVRTPKTKIKIVHVKKKEKLQLP